MTASLLLWNLAVLVQNSWRDISTSCTTFLQECTSLHSHVRSQSVMCLASHRSQRSPLQNFSMRDTCPRSLLNYITVKSLRPWQKWVEGPFCLGTLGMYAISEAKVNQYSKLYKRTLVLDTHWIHAVSIPFHSELVDWTCWLVQIIVCTHQYSNLLLLVERPSHHHLHIVLSWRLVSWELV